MPRKRDTRHRQTCRPIHIDRQIIKTTNLSTIQYSTIYDMFYFQAVRPVYPLLYCGHYSHYCTVCTVVRLWRDWRRRCIILTYYFVVLMEPRFEASL